MKIGIDIDDTLTDIKHELRRGMFNIMITKTMIDEALDFYNISDSEYKEKCYKCIDVLEKNKEYQDKVNEVYKTLFTYKNDKIRSLWSLKNISDLFGNIKHPFITNVLLLSGYKVHKNNIEKYHLDEEQIKINKVRVKECLLNDIKIRKYDGIRNRENPQPHTDPRRWKMASDMLYASKNPNTLRAIIGEDITEDLISFCKRPTITIHDVITENYTEQELEMD